MILTLLLASPSLQEPATHASPVVDLPRLLAEMTDPVRLARWPDPPYQTVQFSSTDRRSRAPGEEGWFANADGFGGEEIPGFEEVLEAPAGGGYGRFLICDVRGPGVMVRGWSAGMGGVLRVWVDEAAEPLWEGPAYDFLARRSRFLAARAGLEADWGDAFVQEDADYLPIPFSRRLRVTWEGSLRELHFYHLEVRHYPAGTTVRPFSLAALAAASEDLTRTAERLCRPAAPAGEVREYDLTLVGGGQAVAELPAGPAAIASLTLKVHSRDLEAALRGTLFRLRFDGADRPQVEVPLGDFFGSYPGLQPQKSLFFSVHPDGVLRCRWLMPYQRSARLELDSRRGPGLAAAIRLRLRPWSWDARSLHFHASWRQGPSLTEQDGLPVDLGFLRVRGSGRLVGLASLLANPSPCPTPAGSWWGEGDEKIFVDGESYPSFLGTGSEDYYNYSWSRPGLFLHPYCGQPVDTGPGNSGYVVNHRLHILDDVPFEHSLDAAMELWPHRAVLPITYARLAWWYGAPGALEDAPPPAAEALAVPALPRWEPQAYGGAANSTFHFFEDLVDVGPRDRLSSTPELLAARGRVVDWEAGSGDRIEVPLPVASDGVYGVHLVALHTPEGGSLRLRLDGEILQVNDPGGSGATAAGTTEVTLRCAHGRRLLSLGFTGRALTAGEHRLQLECTAPGRIGLEYVWVKLLRAIPKRLPGAAEGEELAIAAASPGVEWEMQELGGTSSWSHGQHLWVRARRPGDFVEWDVPVPAPGRYRLWLHLTSSWDYGLLDAFVDGRKVAGPLDTFNPERRVARIPPVDLGVWSLEEAFRLRLALVGSHPDADPPGTFFGLDCVVLEAVP